MEVVINSFTAEHCSLYHIPLHCSLETQLHTNKRIHFPVFLKQLKQILDYSVSFNYLSWFNTSWLFPCDCSKGTLWAKIAKETKRRLQENSCSAPFSIYNYICLKILLDIFPRLKTDLLLEVRQLPFFSSYFFLLSSIYGLYLLLYSYRRMV